MKNILLTLAISLIMTSFSAISQTSIINAIKSGDATELSTYFDKIVEINLPDKSNSYSKSQAELVLRNFFSINPVKDLTIIHQSETAGSQYFIGNLITANGKFRTTVYLKQKGDKLFIQELRFEK
ncbi:MAG: DUF4783 domain-containing protein [Ginsengibacter sp.]